MKLARRIILLVLATFLGVLGALGYAESRRAVHDYRAIVASELAITGRALRAPLHEVLDVEGEARARKLLEIADADIPQSQIHWMSLDSPPPRLDQAARSRLALGEEVTVEDDAGGGRLFVFVPVGPRGAIELSQSLEQERTVVLAIVKERLLVAVFVVLGAALLTILAGVRIVGEPMRKLTEHARTIGGGDLTHRLAINSHDEIGELAVEMNGMASRLADAQKRIIDESDAKVRAVEELRHADRLRTVGTLASGMAHELGTPLGVIAGRAKMIVQDAASPKQNVQYASVIGAQVNQMTRIMRGLLDFARRTPTQKARTDVRELARRSIELLAPLAKKSGVVLKLDDDAQEANAEVDAQQVEQAIANLVVNAIQATEKSGGQVTTDVRTVEVIGEFPVGAPAVIAVDGQQRGVKTRWVRVSVTDTGEGIQEEDRARIFEPFFTTKEVGAGTGLGLSVTHGIVEEHGGFVDVTSTIGSGSSFFLYLPAQEKAP